MANILKEDLLHIYTGLTESERKRLKGSKILVTGFAGSLGYMLVQFFAEYAGQLGIERVYCLDNYIFGKPRWVDALSRNERFRVLQGDVVTQGYEAVGDATLIFHMASLASPVYYRRYPLETIDADVTGLRRLLDFYSGRGIDNLLFYSTSEVYGDPAPDKVPTPESYWGNVNTSGPRACYDESKRFGETLCYNFHHEKQFPVTVVRPFNSYGPGLRTNDKRVIADFALNVLNRQDIVLYSDGKATRTFCYASDTTLASLKCALSGRYDIFNIGNDAEEMTVLELAKLFQRISKAELGHACEIVFEKHEDMHYNTDNPQRRCPDITRIRNALGFAPKIRIEEGLLRYLRFLSQGDRRGEGEA